MVFELPLGATPVKILFRSSGVKLTNPRPLPLPLLPPPVEADLGVRGLELRGVVVVVVVVVPFGVPLGVGGVVVVDLERR